MKIIVLFSVLLGASWALPKVQENLHFKRLYVDPSAPIPERITPRITNGGEVPPHSIPYQAYIIVTGPNIRWLCSGSLITAKHILTAGHCLVDGITALIYLGAHNVEEYEVSQLRVSTNIFSIHPDYNSTTITDDIGIIELYDFVPLNQYINVANISTYWDPDSYVGDIARLSGWGLTEGFGFSSPVLLAANATIVSNGLCNSYFQNIGQSQICTAGTNGVGHCNGDAGGPLVINDILIGIVSFGVMGCTAGYPSVYTIPHRYLGWIQNATQINETRTF